MMAETSFGRCSPTKISLKLFDKMIRTTRAILLTTLRLGLLIFLSVPLVIAQTDDEALANDLRTVIILAGYPCAAVVEHSHPNPSEYQVSCTADKHYRVSVSEEKQVLVESLSDPSLTASRSRTDHESFMKRRLFSIVNLAGHECDDVLAYERRGARDSLVTCQDQTVYRIHVSPEGRLAVERQLIDK